MQFVIAPESVFQLGALVSVVSIVLLALMSKK